MVYWILKFIFSPIIKLVWVKEIEGLENIPFSGAFLIAANHASYLDFLILPAVFKRRIYFLAAEKFFTHPSWAVLMKLTNQIRVDRFSNDKADTYEKALKILAQGKILCIFPEGTRSEDGKLKKAYPGVIKLASIANVSILPVGLTGTYELLSRQMRFPKLKKNCFIKISQIQKAPAANLEDIKDSEYLKRETSLLMETIADLIKR